MRFRKQLCAFAVGYECFLGNMRFWTWLCVIQKTGAKTIRQLQMRCKMQCSMQINTKARIHPVFWLIDGNHDTIIRTHLYEEIDNTESIDWTEELNDARPISKNNIRCDDARIVYTSFSQGHYISQFSGILFCFSLPLPIILYRLKFKRGSTFFVVLAGSILSLIVGGIWLLPFALILGILGFLIAESVLLGKSKLYTFMASGLFFIVTGVLLYLLFALFFGINAIDSLMTVMKESENAIQSFT